MCALTLRYTHLPSTVASTQWLRCTAHENRACPAFTICIAVQAARSCKRTQLAGDVGLGFLVILSCASLLSPMQRLCFFQGNVLLSLARFPIDRMSLAPFPIRRNPIRASIECLPSCSFVELSLPLCFPFVLSSRFVLIQSPKGHGPRRAHLCVHSCVG